MKPTWTSIGRQPEEPEVEGPPPMASEELLTDEGAHPAADLSPVQSSRKRRTKQKHVTTGVPDKSLPAREVEAKRRTRQRRRGKFSTTPESTPLTGGKAKGPAKKPRTTTDAKTKRKRRRRARLAPRWLRMPRVRTHWPLVEGRDPLEQEICAEIKTPKRQYDPDKPSRYRYLVKDVPMPVDSNETKFDALVGRLPVASGVVGSEARDVARRRRRRRPAKRRATSSSSSSSSSS